MPIGVSPDRGVSVMAEQPLGDFTATRRIVMLSAIAIVLGGVSAFLALILLRMIAFVTNLFFFGRLSTATVSPAPETPRRFRSGEVRGNGLGRLYEPSSQMPS